MVCKIGERRIRAPWSGRHLASALGLACLAVAVVSASARAADPVARDTLRVTFPPVDVTALRGREHARDIPATTFIVSREALARSGASRVSTALARLPGFYGYRQTGSGEVSVIDPRGFTANGESSYLKLLVNGHDVRDIENGNVDWDWVLSDDVERVEVIQGSGAWLYGDGSEGGIVNVVRPLAASGIHSDCAARVGSFGLRTGSLALTGGSDAWTGAVHGSLRQADGWRDRSAEDAYTGGGELEWRTSTRVRAGLDAAALDTRREDPGSLTRDALLADRTQSETETDYAHARRYQAGAHLVFAPSADEEWRLAPYFRYEQTDEIRTIFFVPESHPTLGRIGGVELTWRRTLAAAGRPLAITAGGQLEASRLTSDYESTADGALETRTVGRRALGSAFASANLSFAGATSLRLGVRGDAIRLGPVGRSGMPDLGRRTVSQASPFVALSKGNAAGMVYGSFSTGFRVPTLHQLFDARPFFNPFTNQVIFISNADLAPQRSAGFEIGGRWESARVSAVLSAYSVRVRDEIDFDLTRFSYQNLGRSWHRGIELSASHGFARGMALLASGAWTPTTIVGGENDGRQINAVPQGTAYGALSWTAAASSVEAGVRYAGRQWLDKANQHALPDFATAELAASSRVGRVRSTLRVSNLLDRKYADTGFIGAIGEERFVPAAGRGFSLALAFD